MRDGLLVDILYLLLVIYWWSLVIVLGIKILDKKILLIYYFNKIV